jgi:CubicO group peptidase (beta-lactamase class C family)
MLLASSGCDFGYASRVITKQDSSTDDYTWKRAAKVEPSPTPRPWPEAIDCGPVEAALAADSDFPGFDKYLTNGGALSFVVIRNGTIVCEWYGNGGAREKKAAAFSVSKVMTSLLLFRAVADGTLSSLDEKLTDRVPELLEKDERFKELSLANLVDMRSGIAFETETHFPWLNQDQPAIYYASDIVQTLLGCSRIEAPPGKFVYNDYAPNLNGLVMERAYGSRLTDGRMQTLWNELGAEYEASWSVDDKGFPWHESGFVTTARDLARVGQLMLDGGKVNGRQVAPEAFLTRSFDKAGLETAVTYAGSDLGYRNAWWVYGDGELVGMGHHGQIVLVSAPTQTVIVRMGLDSHDDIHELGFDGKNESNVSLGRRFQRVAQRMAGQ